MSDRAILEKAEARVLVHNFIANKQSQDWLTKALEHSKRIYGNGSEERIRAYMRTMWETEFLMGIGAQEAAKRLMEATT